MSAQNENYIVVFKDDVTSEKITEFVNDLNKNGGSVKTRYDQQGGIINGFAGTIPNSYLTSFQSLTGDVIAYIEPDGIVTTQ